ncbi:hypothetical protein [Kitasatospora sp. NPDC004272]
MAGRFRQGDSVRVSSDSYPGDGAHSFVGQVGQVSGYVGETVIVAGLSGSEPAAPGQKYGFFPEEVEPA